MFGGLTAGTTSQTFALLLTPIAAALGVSVATLGGLKTIESVTMALCGLALTPLADKTPRQRLLLAGFALMVLSTLLAASASGPWMFAGYFVLNGASGILLFSTLQAVPSDYAADRAHDRALGYVIGSFGLAGFTTAPLAALLTDVWSWRVGYLLACGVGAAAFAAVALLVPNRPAHGAEHVSFRDGFRLLTHNRAFAEALLGALLRFSVYNATVVYAGALLIKRYHLSVGRSGLYFSLGALCFMLGSIGSGYLLAHVSARRALVPGGALTGLLAGGALLLHPPLPLAGVLLLVAVALMSLQENASAGVLLRLAPRARGAAMALSEIVAAASGLLGIGAAAVALSLFGFGGIGALIVAYGVIAAGSTGVALRHAAD
jgi:predicted MFS family arabinose efflux permease